MAVYRPKYRDPKTGELVESTIWWCEFSFAGKRYRESTEESRKTLALEFEKRKRLGLERFHATGKRPADQANMLGTVREAVKRYRDSYSEGHRAKSVAWVQERSEHVQRLLGGVTAFDLTEDRIRGYIKARRKEGAGNRTINMELDCLARSLKGKWRELWPSLPKLEEAHDIGRALSPEEEGPVARGCREESLPADLPIHPDRPVDRDAQR